MKKRNYFLSLLPALFAMLLSGCYFDIDGDGIGPVVRGSGNLIVEERLVSDFDRILVEGSLDVIVRQGSELYVEVEADDNLQSHIRTSVRGGQLRIANTRSFRSRNDIKVYITLSELEALEIRGSGNVYGENIIEGNDLYLEVDGSGDVDMELYYNEIDSEINGSGNFRLSGEALEQAVRINGSGDYRAADLISAEADINIRGSGNSIVNVSSYLRAEIRGSGDIIYYGNPDVDSYINGSGDLIQR